MKEKILSALKTKYSNLGFGDKAFDGVASYLENNITDETQIETAISGVETLLKSFQGDLDKVRGEKSTIQKELDELKKKNEPQNPQLTEQPIVELPNEAPDWVKAMFEKQNEVIEAQAKQMEQLKTSLGDIQTNNLFKTRSQQFEKATKGLSEELLTPLKQSFGFFGANVGDEEFKEFIEATQKSTKEFVAKQNSYVPGRGGFVKGDISDKEAEELAKGLV